MHEKIKQKWILNFCGQLPSQLRQYRKGLGCKIWYYNWTELLDFTLNCCRHSFWIKRIQGLFLFAVHLLINVYLKMNLTCRGFVVTKKIARWAEWSGRSRDWVQISYKTWMLEVMRVAHQIRRPTQSGERQCRAIQKRNA